MPKSKITRGLLDTSVVIDLEKIERELPIAVERVGHEAVERGPVDAARRHVVHQPRDARVDGGDGAGLELEARVGCDEDREQCHGAST